MTNPHNLNFRPIEDSPRYTALGNERNRVHIEERRARLSDPDQVFMKDGALCWKTNGNVIPLDFLRDNFVDAPAGQKAARDRQVAEQIADYRQSRKDYARNEPEAYAEQQAEQRAMARGAHGPGVEMVNVLTGERYTT